MIAVRTSSRMGREWGIAIYRSPWGWWPPMVWLGIGRRRIWIGPRRVWHKGRP